jgi:hypothetical protein
MSVAEEPRYSRLFIWTTVKMASTTSAVPSTATTMEPVRGDMNAPSGKGWLGNFSRAGYIANGHCSNYCNPKRDRIHT